MSQERSNSAEYLWDRTGPADAEVARLEAVLSSRRHAGREPELVIGPRAELRYIEAPPPAPTAAIHRGGPLAAAAMVMLALLAGLLARPALGPWLKVEAMSGAPRVGAREAEGKLHVGEWLRTDGKSIAQIEVAELGHVTIKPNSKVRVRNTGEAEHRLEMPYGSLYAFITAPPRVFIVDTPGGSAVDMGCEYTLDVEEDGSGILRVSLGHVRLEGYGVESDVPMFGGVCRTKKGKPPGTPYFDDASTIFIDALSRFDFESGGDAALKVVLDEARERDSLSLWHLIRRTEGQAREAVVDRLAQLKPLPGDIARTDVLNLEPGALKAWNEAMRPY